MERAKALRRAQTDAEARLWSRLRASQLGVKFRRQHPVAGYITDFACIEKHVIVELDGSRHAEKTAYDEKRTATLQALGFRVLRFWNDAALSNTDDVLEAIVRELDESSSQVGSFPPHPSPLPRLRRGRGGKIVASDVQPRGFDAYTSAHHLRARLYALIRKFFAHRDVLEVETPILSAAANTEPNIESFMTCFSGPDAGGAAERWMRTSPEFALKRLLAEGIGDCYELGRVFRDGEAGRRHNPEFTMLEWYRIGLNHRAVAEESVALVREALALVDREASVLHTSYRDLFLARLAIDTFDAPIDTLREPLSDIVIDAHGLERDDWLDLLLTHCLQPEFPRDCMTVIHDFPASQCSLARIRRDDPPVAERFELYLGPHELANGYHELCDANEQRARFENDNRRRRLRGQRELPIDENLLASLPGLPACAGVALGVDRLLMCLADTDAIADVLAYAFDQA